MGDVRENTAGKKGPLWSPGNAVCENLTQHTRRRRAPERERECRQNIHNELHVPFLAHKAAQVYNLSSQYAKHDLSADNTCMSTYTQWDAVHAKMMLHAS